MQLTFDFPNQEKVVAELLLEESKLRLGCRASATIAGYAHDWKTFEAWCLSTNRCSFPATIQTVSLFLTDQLSKGRKVSTAQRRMCGVLYTLRQRGCPLDAQAEQAKAVVAGAQRLRLEQPRQMTPLSVAQIAELALKLASDRRPIAARDRSLITLGFASALRRSTLSALTLADITRCGSEGILIRVRKEKQDQTGKGRMIPIPAGEGPGCPLAALEAWLAVRGNAAGPLYTGFDPIHRRALAPISPNAIWKVMKKSVVKIGLNPALYGSHSMRAGFVTEALSRGIGEVRVANHTGHKSLDCLRRYFRPTNPFQTAIGF